MSHDRERSDVAATRAEDTAPGEDDQVGATIRVGRASNRIWPAFPALVVFRAVSRLGGVQRRSHAIGEGGVISVFLDGSNVGSIAPLQIKAYQVSPGDHSLSLHFLGGLRRTRKLPVPLAEGEEKLFVCSLNAMAWPSIRPATPKDVVAMKGWQPPTDAELA